MRKRERANYVVIVFSSNLTLNEKKKRHGERERTREREREMWGASEWSPRWPIASVA